jgi:hypothetical protein
MDQVGIASGTWRLVETIQHSIELLEIGLAILVILLETLGHFNVDHLIFPK